MKNKVANRKKGNKIWIEYLFLNILVLLGLTLILELWRTNIFKYPLQLGGDATQTLYGNMLLADTWVFGYSDRISYPYYAYMSDFPNCGLFINTVRCLVFKLIKNEAFAINMLYIIGYLLAASTAYWSLCKLKISKKVSCIVAILYTFLPFHFMRSVAHLTIGMYWPVPIFMYFLINYMEGNKGYVKNKNGKLSWDSILHILILVVLGGHSIYYTYFSCFFVCVTIVLLFIRKENREIIKQVFIDFAILLGNLAITVIVYIINILRYGTNDQVAARSLVEIEEFGLKIGQLLMPIDGHRLSFLAKWKAEYNELPLTSENAYATLGVCFSIGFIFLIIELVKKTHEDDTVFICAVFNIAAILLATIGGVASVIATFFAQIRCYNRISIFIAFLAAVSFAKICNRLMNKIGGNEFCWTLCMIILAFGLFDQTTKEFIPEYESINAEWNSDKKFITDIESMEEKGARIYQMPYTYYPESLGVNRLKGYDLTKGYMHSDELVWSFGAYKGREGDIWNSYVASMNLEEQISIIDLYGFDGIYVDYYGYTKDEFPIFIEELERYTNSSPLISDNKRLYYFSLCNYEGREISEKEGILLKTFMEYDKGVYEAEVNGDKCWYWCQKDAFINIFNGNEMECTNTITMDIRTFLNSGDYEILVKLNDEVVETLSIEAGENNSVMFPVTLKPGKNVLELSSNIPYDEEDNDSRDLAFRIQNFTYNEPYYQEINCKEGEIFTFGQNGSSNLLMITKGLAEAENGYTWTEGNELEMYCNFGKTEVVCCTISQHLQMTDTQHVKVQVDGKTVFDNIVKEGDDISFAFENNSKDMTCIKLFFKDAVSPRELGLGDDERELAIALRSISFTEK